MVSETPLKAIIVTGSRHATTQPWAAVIREAIAKSLDPRGRFIVIHGDARGIDRIAGDVAERLTNVNVIPVPAQWDTLGNAAGPRRNEAMLSVLTTLRDHGYRVAVFAFHDDLKSSKGTGHMARIAASAGLNVINYRSDGTSERVSA